MVPPISHRDGLTIHPIARLSTSKAVKRDTNTTGRTIVFGLTQDGYYTLAFEEDIHHSKMDLFQAMEAYRTIGIRLHNDIIELLSKHILPKIIQAARDRWPHDLPPEYFEAHPDEDRLMLKLTEGYRMMVAGDGMPLKFALEIAQMHSDMFPNETL
jgi:hypothetical protein